MEPKSSFMTTICAASSAPDVPEPCATPTLAALSAGASFRPKALVAARGCSSTAA